MSVPRRPFYYTPDEYFSFGLAGEHPVEFMAWIGECGPNELLPVEIISVIVHWRFKDPMTQFTDIREQVLEHHRERYEDEIRHAFERAKERDWECA